MLAIVPRQEVREVARTSLASPVVVLTWRVIALRKAKAAARRKGRASSVLSAAAIISPVSALKAAADTEAVKEARLTSASFAQVLITTHGTAQMEGARAVGRARKETWYVSTSETMEIVDSEQIAVSSTSSPELLPSWRRL